MELADQYMVIFRSLLKDKSLKYIIDLCSDVLEKPVMLHFVENGGWYIYSSKYPLNAPDIQEILDTGVSSPEVIQAHKELQTEELAIVERIFLLDAGYFSSCPRIIRSICFNGRLIAMLCVMTGSKAFCQRDFDLADIVGQILEEELQKGDGPQFAMYEHLMQDILQGKEISDSVNQNNWRAAAGWFRGTGFYMCLVRGENGIHLQDEMLLRRKTLYMADLKMTMFEGDLVFFLHTASPNAFQERLLDLEKMLEETDYCCIVSERIESLAEMRKQYILLYQAWSTAQLIFPGEKIVHKKNLTTFTMLNWANAQGDLAVFRSAKLERLLAYDQEFGTDYTQTLQTFLAVGSRKQVAEKMRLHKNTINYRLQKIEEIIDADLENGETRFALQLGFYIHRYLKKRNNPM